MSGCSLVTTNIGTASCKKITGGVAPTFYIANKDEIVSYAPASGNAMVIEGITMVSGKKFFTVAGKLQSVEPKVTIKPGKYQNSTIHETTFLIFDLQPLSLLQINKMIDGNFVLIIQNNETGVDGNTKYDVYGIDGGMRISGGTMEKNNTDTLGAVQLTLTTPDYALEGDFVKRFYDTDSATTEADIAALLV